MFDKQEKLEKEELEALVAQQEATASLQEATSSLIRIKRQKHKLRIKAKKVLAREALVLKEQELSEVPFPPDFDFSFLDELGEAEPVSSRLVRETPPDEVSP